MSSNSRFRPLEDLAINLAQLHPDLNILPSTNVCKNCHKRISKMILSDLESISENEITELFSGRDDDFIPKTPERIEELNESINSVLPECISPLKRKTAIPENFRGNYVSKKKKILNFSFFCYCWK
ncbi:hypothetical protein [Escherichia coli]|uniref:hypothetical protein n=1 Tax=Escherichia coli TaxID=562 RepID=UPI002916B1FB|nr:hypothetical protein [Escherichia coli]